MRFFSGFCLQDEEVLFSEYLVHSEFCVAGFSYGAQQAMQYALSSQERIDRLILLSPAFFQTMPHAQKMQDVTIFMNFTDTYTTKFVKHVAHPSKADLSPYFKLGTPTQLEELFMYVWQKNSFEILKRRGVQIEVFLGGKDKILPIEDAYAFFKEMTTTYFIKDAGHLLKTRE